MKLGYLNLISVFIVAIINISVVAQVNTPDITVWYPGPPDPTVHLAGDQIDTTFNLTVTKSVDEFNELTAFGTYQRYSIGLYDPSTSMPISPEKGRIISITVNQKELYFSDSPSVLDGWRVIFDENPSSPPPLKLSTVLIESDDYQMERLMTVRVKAEFSEAGEYYIVLSGSVNVVTHGSNGRIILNTFTASGFPRIVDIMEVKLRADSNKDGTIDSNDDLSGIIPGLFVPVNGSRDAHIIIEGIADPTIGYFQWASLSKNQQSHVNISANNNMLLDDNNNVFIWDLWRSSNDNTYLHSRDNFDLVKEDLTINGISAGESTLNICFYDEDGLYADCLLKVRSWEVELLVNKSANENIPLGKPIVVLNNAVRCEAKLVSGEQDDNVVVYIANNNNNNKIKYSIDGVDYENSITIELDGNGDPSEFYIIGNSPSDSVGDASIVVRLDDQSGNIVSTDSMTVLWVDVSWKYTNTDVLSTENTRHDMMYYYLGNTDRLGITNSYNPIDGRKGWAYEIRGEVFPNNFKENISLGRNWEMRRYRNNNVEEFTADLPNEENWLQYNDLCLSDFQKNNPNPIFDNDCPGVPTHGNVQTKGAIQRLRANFYEFARYNDGIKDIQCSIDFGYFIRLSYIQTDDSQVGKGDNWQILNSNNCSNESQIIEGDNTAERITPHCYPTSLEWDLSE